MAEFMKTPDHLIMRDGKCLQAAETAEGSLQVNAQEAVSWFDLRGKLWLWRIGAKALQFTIPSKEIEPHGPMDLPLIGDVPCVPLVPVGKDGNPLIESEQAPVPAALNQELPWILGAPSELITPGHDTCLAVPERCESPDESVRIQFANTWAIES